MGMETELAKAQALDSLIMQRDNIIDLQVILQILVKQGITTKEEVDELRAKVANNSKKVKKLDAQAKELSKDVKTFTLFMEMMEKKKNGTITEEERKWFADIINKDPKTYGKYAMDYFKSTGEL